ncbi:MAG: UbiH/UbiF/VisC/COQ6 family ubiquinone biosynthesis hydroxylase [Chromatiales bacterium]|nr:UbiH/UbiF/VisC/COQ6 family ubiquinone biosynthesis hydroxylase [Gammaproteobacteria bacterium]MBW6477655.1 UbiH/UbiF/VisC/COQ6 family ubiquinone biosynthesis hydroxylase [Chromatiales bacterium]
MQYDVLIVGGGMVGASLACALGDGPLRVGLIESHPAEQQWDEAEFDIRVSAITRASEQVFRAVGAWAGMRAKRVRPYQAMQVWDGTGSGSIHFDAADIGEPNLGHIIENRVILAALLERMADFSNLDRYCPAQITAIHREESRVTVSLADGQQLQARLVVGADGSGSLVRREAGIETIGWSYDQHAVVATIRTERSHQDCCWQRFMPDGPLAFLPLPGGFSSIVWSTTPERAAELLAMPEADFLSALQQAFGDRLGAMLATGPRAAFPLMLRHAKRYTDPRLVLVGNAAHAIHPLAGQGLNLGVSDVAALAEVLLAAQAKGEDIGELAVLRRYERWRKGDNLAVMAAMDGFKRLFGNQHLLLQPLRNLGLRLADQAAPLKSRMIRRAMGLEGDLPQLCRGFPLC